MIICCYNSALRLSETLRHLSVQKVPAYIAWEVIVVNNASQDETEQMAGLVWNKLRRTDVTFKIVQQPVAGLTFAREKGVSTAVYDYLIFCDDDNWLFENYVFNAYNLMQKWDTCGIIGGYGHPKPEKDPPEWFNAYKTFYATGPQNSQNGIIEGISPYVYGAGAVIRKTVFRHLKNIGFKPLATDRLNDKLSSGGDVEICYAIKLLGYEIAYSDDLKFFHFIPQNRLTTSYILNLVYQFGYCNIVHRPYFWLFNPSLPLVKKTFAWTLGISVHIYLLSLKNSIKKSNYLDNFITMVNLQHARGRLDAICKLNFKIVKSYNLLVNQFKSDRSTKGD